MENTLKTRIQLKYDTYENWAQSELILKKGEIGIAEIPGETEGSNLTPPAIGIKVGDGEKQFSALPWIQAVAGDVAAWAKTQNKPVYKANEIQGLEEFISGEINDTNTQYQIVTEDEGQTYKLQKKDVGEEAYSDVSGSTIDLKSIFTQLSTLSTQIEAIDVTSQITTEIEKLDYSDTAVDHQFVTQVTETNGVIEVTRAQPEMADVNGLTEALAAKQDSLEFITPYNSETNKVATKSDIDTALQGLSGALKFKGTQESLPENTEGYEDGDVIFVNSKEYVCESSEWRELGDETSFAIKGSITNSDIAEGANIDQSKINGLEAALADAGTIKKITVNGSDVTINEEKTAEIKLADIAVDGEVKNLKQTDDTILVLNCGSSTTVTE